MKSKGGKQRKRRKEEAGSETKRARECSLPGEAKNNVINSGSRFRKVILSSSVR